MELELERLKNIHLVGVGGCGMSGIAKVLLEMGFKVSGSDQKEGVNTIRLKDLGVKIFIDHESSQVRDADILVYDPNRKRTISAKTHHMDCDYSCYEGREIQGGSDIVISRGTIVWKDGEFIGRKGHGTYLRRDRADWVRKN